MYTYTIISYVYDSEMIKFTDKISVYNTSKSAVLGYNIA